MSWEISQKLLLNCLKSYKFTSSRALHEAQDPKCCLSPQWKFLQHFRDVSWAAWFNNQLCQRLKSTWGWSWVRSDSKSRELICMWIRVFAQRGVRCWKQNSGRITSIPPPQPSPRPLYPPGQTPRNTHTLIHTNPMSSPLREQSLLSKQGARRTPRVGARILWVWPDTGGSGSRKWSLGLTCTICKMKQLDVTLLTLTIYDSCLTHWGALLAFSRLYQALVATTSQLWEDFLSISSPCSMWSL